MREPPGLLAGWGLKSADDDAIFREEMLIVRLERPGRRFMLAVFVGKDVHHYYNDRFAPLN